MNPNAEFDLIVYGASGYTGRLVAEHLAKRYGVGGEVKWAMAGRSAAKLAEVRDEIGAPADTPLVVADAADPAQVREMVRRTKAVITTVGPYQLYGSELVAACARRGPTAWTSRRAQLDAAMIDAPRQAQGLRRADPALLRLRLDPLRTGRLVLRGDREGEAGRAGPPREGPGARHRRRALRRHRGQRARPWRRSRRTRRCWRS
jgi:hypothetical protein